MQQPLPPVEDMFLFQPVLLLLRRIAVAITVGLPLLYLMLFHGTPGAYAIQAKPPTNWSFYMFRPDSNAAYNVGCNQGHSDANNGKINSEVILDFGGQWSGTDYNGIEAAAEQFAKAYFICTGSDTTSVVTLGLGTNNSADPNYITYSGGATWANMVKTVAAWVSNNGYSTQVTIDGANDIEPSWSSAAAARSWAQGYASVGSVYLNYGSADGCPQYSTGNGSCNNGWTQDDEWYVSWGSLPALPTPEIYYNSMARQWAMISLYGSQAHGSTVYMQGPMDEYDEDTSTLNSDAAWNALWTDLNNNAATAQNMTYSLQIHTINFG